MTIVFLNIENPHDLWNIFNMDFGRSFHLKWGLRKWGNEQGIKNLDYLNETCDMNGGGVSVPLNKHDKSGNIYLTTILENYRNILVDF